MRAYFNTLQLPVKQYAGCFTKDMEIRANSAHRNKQISPKNAWSKISMVVMLYEAKRHKE